MSDAIVIGIDIGTSGARALAMDATCGARAQTSVLFEQAGSTVRDPAHWWKTVSTALAALLEKVDPDDVRAIAIDGTSGTVLPVDVQGEPLAKPLMYNDAVGAKPLVDRIGQFAPAESAAHGASSGLAKALTFLGAKRLYKTLHQADWIAGKFSGRFDLTDENNALKTGYDPAARRWPDWIAEVGLPLSILPNVEEPGALYGRITPETARLFSLSHDVLIVAGTTDGCASFLATGASQAGDGVTALGSSLTLKLLSDRPVFAPLYGIYSHRIGDVWLAGGASNTGGRVLAQFFTMKELTDLSDRIDPVRSSGLDYYPLPAPGERFPIADPDLQSRIMPRPDDEAVFLQGLLEGITAIESLGYQRLVELGAPKLTSLRAVGGGSVNQAWKAIRQNALAVPFLDPESTEAAAGAARLALKGARSAGVLS